MKVRRSTLAVLAAGAMVALSAQAASAASGPPPRFKPCGPPFTYTDDLGTRVTLTMLFPSYINSRYDQIWLRLTNLSVVHFAGGDVEGWSDEPLAYNLPPLIAHRQASRWFHSPAIDHTGGLRRTSVTIRPIPGRLSALGGRFWVPSAVTGCTVR
jgi:hypothetical protein